MNTKTKKLNKNFICMINEEMQRKMEELRNNNADINWSYLVRKFINEQIKELDMTK